MRFFCYDLDGVNSQGCMIAPEQIWLYSRKARTGHGGGSSLGGIRFSPSLDISQMITLDELGRIRSLPLRAKMEQISMGL